MRQHTTLGDCQRFGTIKLKHLVASVKWRRIVDNKMVNFVNPIASSVTKVLLNMQNQQNKNFEMLPIAIKEQFDVQEIDCDPKDYEVTVSFSPNAEYQSFSYAYCHLCSNNKCSENHTGKHILRNSLKMYLFRFWLITGIRWANHGIKLAFLVAFVPTILLTPYISTPKWSCGQETLALCPRRIKGYEEIYIAKIFYLCPPYVFIFNSNFRGGNLSNAIAHFSNSKTSDAVEIVK